MAVQPLGWRFGLSVRTAYDIIGIIGILVRTVVRTVVRTLGQSSLWKLDGIQ